MEQPEDTRPISAKFTAPHDVTIVSEDGGQCAVFEAGQTREIGRRLFSCAITAGLIPETPIEAPPAVPENKTREESVSEGLLEACKILIARGNPGDFTVVGHPRAAPLKKLVNFDFTGREAKEAFDLAMHEVEQDGNDSPEHSESSSSVTE